MTANNSFLTSLFSLQGRVALVTGAGSGLGKYMSYALLQAGANLILVGRDKKRLESCARELYWRASEASNNSEASNSQSNISEATGTSQLCFDSTPEFENIINKDFTKRIACIPFDVSELEALSSLAKLASEPFGSPDILINAAGVNPRLPWNELTPKSWDNVLRLNLSAPFFLAQALMPAMQKKAWGRIINIASLQSVRAFCNGAPYGASKGGIAQVTRAMAEAWSLKGNSITANAIAPGFFKTNLTALLFENTDSVQALEKQTMFARVGEAKDILGLTVFLASQASDYLTGQVIYLDGGWTAK